MSHEGIRFEVGQVWANTDMPSMTYEVFEIERYESYDGYYSFIARTHNCRDGRLIQNGYFRANTSCEPFTLSDKWYLVKGYKGKTFSRVNPRTLRKRMREQMAAAALTHRLTE